MDPLYTISRHDAHMVQQIFDRLVEYDFKSEQLLPRIAHHWESPDGKRMDISPSERRTIPPWKRADK